MLAGASLKNVILTAVIGGACYLAVSATKCLAVPTLFEVPNTHGTTAIAPANYNDARGPGILVARENRISLISASGGRRHLVGSGHRCPTNDRLCGEGHNDGNTENRQAVTPQPIQSGKLDLNYIVGMAMGHNDDVFFLELVPQSPEPARIALRYFSNASNSVETISDARGIFRAKATDGSFKEITIISKKVISTRNESVYFSGTTADFVHGNDFRDALWRLSKDDQGWFVQEVVGNEAILKLETGVISDISATPTGCLLAIAGNRKRVIEIQQLDGNAHQPPFVIERLTGHNQDLFRGIAAVTLDSDNRLIVGGLYPGQIVAVSENGLQIDRMTKFPRPHTVRMEQGPIGPARIPGKPASASTIDTRQIISTPEYNGYFVLAQLADSVYFIGPYNDSLINKCINMVAGLNAADSQYVDKVELLTKAFKAQITDPLDREPVAQACSRSLARSGPRLKLAPKTLSPREAVTYCPMLALPKDMLRYINTFVQHRTPEEHMFRWRAEMLRPSLHNLIP